MLKKYPYQILFCFVMQSFLYGMDLRKAIEQQQKEDHGTGFQPVQAADTSRVSLFGDEVFEEFPPIKSGDVASKKPVDRSKNKEKSDSNP